MLCGMWMIVLSSWSRHYEKIKGEKSPFIMIYFEELITDMKRVAEKMAIEKNQNAYICSVSSIRPSG